MKNNQTRLLMILAVLIITALACEGSFSTANISDAWMSTDQEGDQRTTTFAPDEIFYAQVDLNNAPEDTSVRVVWIAEDVEDTEPEFQMNEFEYVGDEGGLFFELENSDYLWPNGQYRVDIYLNGEFDRSLSFSVQ
ncbi:MAG TPA: hypothetical protein VJ965_06990 [Anaerolineales bacterium]|nr:hypothetical protein [Anaerolineales bacterium]